MKTSYAPAVSATPRCDLLRLLEIRIHRLPGQECRTYPKVAALTRCPPASEGASRLTTVPLLRDAKATTKVAAWSCLYLGMRLLSHSAHRPEPKNNHHEAMKDDEAGWSAAEAKELANHANNKSFELMDKDLTVRAPGPWSKSSEVGVGLPAQKEWQAQGKAMCTRVISIAWHRL